MERIIIDLTGVNSRIEFWKQVKEAIDAPDYFGNNLDAFHDYLSELASPTEFVFVNTDDFKAALPDYFEALDEMLTNVVEQCDNIFVSYEDYM